jgi:hypothetical protein
MPNNTKKIFKIASFSLFFLFIIIYALFRSEDLILGVKIRKVNLVDNTKFTDSILPVTGNARNAVKLTLNGQEISINQAGDFNETIILLPGYKSLASKRKTSSETLMKKIIS